VPTICGRSRDSSPQGRGFGMTEKRHMNTISILGRQFTLSPLTLGDLRKLEPALLGIEKDVEKGFAAMLSLVPVIHASLSKLHPEVALEELEQMLDLNSFTEVLDRVLHLSGLKRASSPSASPGEHQPAAE
jgi:hypothetical protein